MATGGPLVFAYLAAGLVLGSTSAAQVSYLSQNRSVRASSITFTAQDFDPFHQTAAWSSPGGGCESWIPQSASATHDSELSDRTVAFALHATSRSIMGGSLSALTVSFTVDPGSLFTLQGQVTFGSSTGGTGLGRMMLEGAGLNIDFPTLPHGLPQSQTVSSSGTFRGGTYTLTAYGSASSYCAGGSPGFSLGDSHGTVTITPARCRADWDHNGVVEPMDVSRFAADWLECIVNGRLTADFDGNGAVEPADVALFVQAWFDAVVQGPC